MALDASLHGGPGAMDAGPRAVIGPNAVLQTETALAEAGGRALAERVFARAGLSRLLVDRPGAMIDEAVPQALFSALFDTLPDDQARAVAHRAGRLTGAYILENRIPAPVRALLRLMPPRLAAPALLSAIWRHAWTFAGSGVCAVEPGRPARIVLRDNPLTMPGCVWHVGVFEVLFTALVSPRATVRHDHDRDGGVRACRFDIAW